MMANQTKEREREIDLTYYFLTLDRQTDSSRLVSSRLSLSLSLSTSFFSSSFFLFIGVRERERERERKKLRLSRSVVS